MSDYLSILPVELIEKILNNIPIFDILSSVCLVNKRFRSIFLACPRFRLNFHRISMLKKNQFDIVCSQLIRLSSRIVSLTLDDEDFPETTAMKNLLFSRLNTIDGIFVNLRHLTLTHINYDT